MTLKKTALTALLLAGMTASGLAICPSAHAQSDEIFEMQEASEDGLSTEEYDNVPPGLLMAPKQAAPAEEITDTTTSTTVISSTTSQMSYEAAVDAYKTGKFNDAMSSLAPLAEKGHMGATELVGIMYRMGQGTEKNFTKALPKLEAAAADKRPLALHHLGIMYFMGEGVDKDLVKALMYMHLAIIYYPDGAEKERAKQDRDSIFKLISRRDKETALDFTREWLATKGEAHVLDLYQP